MLRCFVFLVVQVDTQLLNRIHNEHKSRETAVASLSVSKQPDKATVLNYVHIVPEFGWSSGGALLTAEIWFYWGLLWWIESSSFHSGIFVPAPVLPPCECD